MRTIYTRQILDPDKLNPRQRSWEEGSTLCRAGTPGAVLFVEAVPGSRVIHKWRFDIWRSEQFTSQLDAWGIDGLVIGGVELQCCVLYAILGAEERGYHYLVPQDLVSGLDSGGDTYNRAVRWYLSIVHPSLEGCDTLLDRWRHRAQSG